MLLDKYKVIDAHCHVYPEKIASAAVNATDAFYGVRSQFDGSTECLLNQMAESGVDHALVQSVATTPKQVKSINNFIAKTVSEANGRFTGLGTLHPDSKDLEGDVNEILSLNLKGVKLHPDIQRFKIDDYRCLKIYELCEKNHLPILMHTGDSRYDFSNPNRLLPVLEIYTSLVIVGGHFGGYSVWDEAAEKLSGLDNFYVDTSSTMAFIGKDRAKKLIERYTPDKVIYASDYPMYPQKEELETLLEMGFSEHQYKKMFYENAKKVFGL